MSGEDLNTPKDFVQSGWTWVQGLSLNVLGKAFTALDALYNLDVSVVPTEVTYEAHVSPGTFVPPPAPISPDFQDITYTTPEMDTPKLPTLKDFGQAPSEPTFSHYVYAQPGGIPGDPPAAIDPTELRPALADVTIPASPTPPPDPTFFPIVLPAVPDITIPAFLSQRPQVTVSAPGHTFAFTETPYTDALLTDIKSKLTVMLDTGSGLDPLIETAIFDRARAREDKAAAQATQEIADEFGARGFSLPPGVQDRRMREVRQKNQDAANTQSRDLAIEMAKIAIENVKFAAAQGIACEQMLIQQQMQINQRAFEASRTAEELAISLFNAKVAELQMLKDLYVADATVYAQTALEPAKVKADVYRAEVEGQKAVADVDKALADVYTARVEGITSLRKSDIDAALGQLQVNAQKLDQVRLLIQNLSELNKSYEIQWEGYKARIEAALAPLKADETLAQIYTARVSAYSAKGNISIEQQKSELQVELTKLEKFKAQIQLLIADIQGKGTVEESKARALTAQGSVYAAAGTIAQAEASTLDRAAEIAISNANNRAQVELKNAEIQSQNALQLLQITLKKLEGLATVYSQLSASVLSGVRFGADYNGHLNFGVSYGKSFGYSGGTPDASPDF